MDVVVTTSGLFRDIYGQVLILLDRSFRSAVAASYATILQERPELSVALDAAMQPLRDAKLFDGVKGNDPLSRNYVARHWVESVSGMVYDLKNAGLSDQDAWSRAGILSMLRIFAPPVGDYGAGVSHAVEQAWTWDNRGDIADLYLQRMGHAYSEQVWGENQAGIFKDLLTGVSNAFHSRSSNLYGVLDNDDCFDYFGGLSMAIEYANGGKAPDMYILDYANPAKAGVMTFNDYITRELRTRYYNPEWIKGMMEYGYSGARTISNKFVSYLWGWQVTNPDTVKKWMWDEVADVYVRDKYGLGVNTWLSQGNNAYALISVTGTMLTAAQKGFWQADEATLKEIADTWAKAVIQHGPACCDCSCGNISMMKWTMMNLVDPSLLKQLNNVLFNATQQQVLSSEELAALTPRSASSSHSHSSSPPPKAEPPQPQLQEQKQELKEELKQEPKQEPEQDPAPQQPEQAGAARAENPAAAQPAGTPGEEAGSTPVTQQVAAANPAPAAEAGPGENTERAYEVEKEQRRAAAAPAYVPVVAVLGVVALVALGAAGFFFRRFKGM